MAEHNVEIGFLGNLEGVRVSITQLSELLRGLVSPIQGVREHLGEVAEAFAAAFAIEKITEFARHMGETAEGIEKVGAQLGISTDQVQQLGYLARSSGTSLDALGSEFARMAMGAGEQSDRMIRGLRTFGLSIRDVQSGDAISFLTKFSEAYSKLADGTTKAAATQAVWGRGAREAALLFNQGAEGIKRHLDELAATQSIISPDAIAGLAALHHEFVMMDTAIQGAEAQAFIPFRGAVQGTVAIVADLASAFSEAMKSGGLMKSVIDFLATGLKGAVTAVAGAVYVFRDLWATASFGIDTIGNGFLTLGGAISRVVVAIATGWQEFFAGLIASGMATVRALGAEFNNLLSLGSAAARLDLAGVKSAWAEMGSAATTAGKEIGAGFARAGAGVDLSGAKAEFDKFNTDQTARNKAFTDTLIKNDQAFASEYKKIWDNIHAHEEGDRPAPKFDPRDKQAADRVAAALKAIDGEVKAEQDGLKRKESVWTTAVSLNQMTNQQRLANDEEATEASYNIERAALSRGLDIPGLKLAQRQELNNKLEALERSHQQRMIDLDHEAVTSAAKDIEGYLSTVTGAFNSQLRGLLAGTTSFRSAMKAIAGDLIISMIQGIESWVVKWIAGQLAATTASTTGAAARAAADTAGSATSIATTIATALSKIGAGVSATIAGVTGNLALILGPAAPAAGAAAGAETAAAATAALVLDTGAWQIGAGVTPAFLHPGEMVLPGPSADMMRDALGGGGSGGDIHLHVSAVDGASVARLFQNNGMQLASVLRDVWQNNRSVRPAF